MRTFHEEESIILMNSKARFQVPGRPAVLALVCIALTVLPISAHSDTGTIAGTITDPTGAVLVPQASVTVTNQGTSAQTSLQSSDSGNFVASALPFGNYVVSATASGFATATSR